MPDITGTANYQNYLDAIDAYRAAPSIALGKDWGKQLAVCWGQTGTPVPPQLKLLSN